MAEAVVEQKRIEETALAVPDKATALVIATDADLVKAGEFLTGIKGLQKEVDGAFNPIIKKALEAHKEALSQKKRAGAPLVQAEGIIKPKIAIYTAEQERKRREEEARIRREQEEKERQKKIEEEKRLKEAEALEAEGKQEEADGILNEPEPEEEPAPIVIPPAPTKVEGVSIKKVWKFRIADEDKIPRKYLIVDEKMIGQIVRAEKDKCEIPGVEVYSEDQVSARSR